MSIKCYLSLFPSPCFSLVFVGQPFRVASLCRAKALPYIFYHLRFFTLCLNACYNTFFTMSFLSQAEKHSIKDAVEGIVSTGSGERFVLSGLTGSSKAYILAKSFLSSKKPFLVVLPDNEIAEEFAHDLEFFLKKENIRFYPATELLPFERQETHPEIAAKRMEFLHSLAIIGRSFDSTQTVPPSPLRQAQGSGRTDSFDSSSFDPSPGSRRTDSFFFAP